jgi:hypothetical protein
VTVRLKKIKKADVRLSRWLRCHTEFIEVLSKPREKPVMRSVTVRSNE